MARLKRALQRRHRLQRRVALGLRRRELVRALHQLRLQRDQLLLRLVDGALQPVTLVHQPALLGQGGLRLAAQPQPLLVELADDVALRRRRLLCAARALLAGQRILWGTQKMRAVRKSQI